MTAEGAPATLETVISAVVRGAVGFKGVECSQQVTRDKKSSGRRLLFVRSEEVKDAEDVLFLGCGAHRLRGKVP